MYFINGNQQLYVNHRAASSERDPQDQISENGLLMVFEGADLSEYFDYNVFILKKTLP